MLIKILIFVVLAFAAFIWWRITSVGRGSRRRDRVLLVLLNPLAARFQANELVTAEDITTIAASPQYRPLLYQLLDHFHKTDLFPQSLLSQQAQGEGLLAYWLMHPNELQGAPVAIEHVATFSRQALGRTGDFFVYRYRMPEWHWAGSDWLLGLAGPFFPGEEPFRGARAGFLARATASVKSSRKHSSTGTSACSTASSVAAESPSRRRSLRLAPGPRGRPVRASLGNWPPAHVLGRTYVGFKL